MDRQQHHIATVTICLLLLLCPAFIVAAGEHEHAEGIMEELDADHDGSLDQSELAAFLSEFVDDSELRSSCPGAAQLIAEYDADSSGGLEEAELHAASGEIMGCVLEATTTSTISVERDGVMYTCHAPLHEHDHEHDHEEEHEEHGGEGESDEEHDHHHHGAEESVVVTVAGEEWECAAAPALEAVADTSIATIAQATLAVAAVSLLAVLGAALIIPFDKCMKANTDIVAAFAMGSLLAAIFLHMLPELVAENGGSFSGTLGLCTVGGFLVTFVLEQATHFARDMTKHEVAVHAAQAAVKHGAADVEQGGASHSHAQVQQFTMTNPAPRAELQSVEEMKQAELRAHVASGEHEKHHHSIGALAYTITLGDTVHSFVDGLLIAVSFQGCDAQLGWTVAGAIALHEVPAEFGDFMLLKQAGLSTCRALMLNIMASMGAFVGMAVAFIAGTGSQSSIPIMLAIGSGQLLFVVATDIVPTLTKPSTLKGAVASGAACLLGLGLVSLTLLYDVHCGAGHAH